MKLTENHLGISKQPIYPALYECDNEDGRILALVNSEGSGIVLSSTNDSYDVGEITDIDLFSFHLFNGNVTIEND